MSKVNRAKLVTMLASMRPAYSLAEQAFCDEHLLPIFGEPDPHGNYIKVIGNDPTVAFTAHTDTVHRAQGIQSLVIEHDFVTSSTGSCLGADCTTGVWLLLGMIEAGIEGVYVAHAAEEIGGLGSAALVADRPLWLDNIQVCLSFDRFGTDSIITHQCGRRTASNAFATSLADILDMPSLKPDSTGVYTDSAEYADLVPECSNLSVGYYDQHTTRESQDLLFAEMLLQRLIQADWSALVVSRDLTQLDEEYGSPFGSNWYEDEDDTEDLDALHRLLIDRPYAVAELLLDYGLNVEAMVDELGLSVTDLEYYTNEYSSKAYY